MHGPADPLPAEVVAALKRSRSDQAVLLLHKATGLSLTEAKLVIDERLQRTGKPKGTVLSMLGLPFAVSSALRQGNKIEAIRLLRERAGLGLKEAKDAIESFDAENSEAQGNRSPGEVPRSGGAFWLVSFLAAAALLGYYYFFWRSS